MPDYPKVGAEQVLIHDQYDRAIKDVIDLADKADKAINDIGGRPVDVKINVEDSEIGSTLLALDDLKEDPSIKVNVDDNELNTANDLVDDIDAAAPNVKVNTDDTEVDEVQDKLDDIIALQVITLAVDVVGTGVSFVQSLGRFSGIGGVLEMDSALAMIEGRTGRMIPQAKQLINDLYTDGWGESREEISGVIIAAANLGIANEDLAEATESAFQTAAVTGGETNEILRTMDSLVKNDLVSSYSEAADVIVTGFQTGADRGQDLLDTFNEYGTTFGQLRISGDGALALINSGLAAGIDNSDRIADSIREASIKLAEMGTNEDIATAFERLDELSDVDLAGLFDAYSAGEITGDEFWNGFFAAFADANATNPQEAASLATDLIGTQSEDFKIGAFSQLSTEWDSAWGEMEGRAEEGGTAISDTLQTKLDTFWRWVETEATNFLSSDQINLDQKIEDIKTGLTEAMSILAEGGTLGEAIEIGLNIPGFADSVTRFESGVGNFLISVLELVAGIQDMTGNSEGAEATRLEIARLAEQQLAFDIQIGNEDEVAGAIQRAIDRGVDPDTIAGIAATAVNEMLASGDIEGAQTIIDTLNTLSEELPVIAEGLNGEQIAMAAAALREFQNTGDSTRINEQLAAGTLVKVNVDTTDMQSQIDAAVAEAEAAWVEAINAGDFNLAQQIAEGLGDPALLADTFRAAIQGQDFGVATAIAESMSDNPEFLQQAFDQAFSAGAAGLAVEIAEQLGDPELIAQAEALADSYKAAFDTAMETGDVDTAARLAEMLDDDSLRAKVDELREQVDQAAEDVTTASDDMAGAVEGADERISTAATDNTITASFQAVSDSAALHFPTVIDWVNQAASAVEGLDAKARRLYGAAGAIRSMAAEVSQFPLAQLEAITNAAMGFAGAQTIVNNGGDTTNNININNNPQNNAQAAADTYTVGAIVAV